MEKISTYITVKAITLQVFGIFMCKEVSFYPPQKYFLTKSQIIANFIGVPCKPSACGVCLFGLVAGVATALFNCLFINL